VYIQPTSIQISSQIPGAGRPTGDVRRLDLEPLQHAGRQAGPNADKHPVAPLAAADLVPAHEAVDEGNGQRGQHGEAEGAAVAAGPDRQRHEAERNVAAAVHAQQGPRQLLAVGLWGRREPEDCFFLSRQRSESEGSGYCEVLLTRQGRCWAKDGVDANQCRYHPKGKGCIGTVFD
jgi:hypothetical protein